MSTITQKSALQKAIDLAKHSEGYIDVIKLAGLFGVGVFIREMEEEESAFIEYREKEGTFSIVVNPKHSKLRQRFSIAHELAHFVLHPEKVKKHRRVDRKGEKSLSMEEEKKADELAATILMPEPLVKQFVNEVSINTKKPLDKSVISILADHFNVSPLVAIMRMRKLGCYVPYIVF